MLSYLNFQVAKRMILVRSARNASADRSNLAQLIQFLLVSIQLQVFLVDFACLYKHIGLPVKRTKLINNYTSKNVLGNFKKFSLNSSFLTELSKSRENLNLG